MGNIGQPVAWSTNQAPLTVLAEADLALLPTLTFQSGTLCTVNDPSAPVPNSFVWVRGSAAASVAGISVAATGGAWISVGTMGTSVRRFNTITAGAAGSGRLVDIPTAEFLALPTGTLAYTGNNSATVPSVHSLWMRMTSPTAISSDSITILKPLGGVSREIWVRLPTPSYYWQSRLAGASGPVVVDGAAGSDENFGNAAAPLLTEAEAVRRLGSSQTQTFVFKPGATTEATGNVYADWAQLVAACALNAGPKTIYFDDSLAARVIPVGAWNLGEGCTWRGVLPAINSASPNRVQVSCANGVTLTAPLYELADMQLTYSGVGALMTIPAPGAQNRVFYMSRNARTNSTGAGGRIFEVPAGAIWNVVMLDLATIVVAGGGLFCNVLAGATQFALRVVESGSTAVKVPANCLAGPAGPTYQFISDIIGVFTVAQAAMPTGTITVTFVDGAPNLPYTPAAGANWVDPDPTTVQSALDRIAAVVSAGGATPIP